MRPIRLNGTDGKISLTPVTSTILRLSILPVAEPTHRLFDKADITPRAWARPAAELTEANGAAQVGEFSVSVSGDPTSISITRNDRVVQRLLLDGDKIRFDLSDSRVYGLGHGFNSQMNRRGGTYDMSVNGQLRGIIENGSATCAIPYLIGTGGWGLFFHLPWNTQISLNGLAWEMDQEGFDGYCERRDTGEEFRNHWDLFVVDAATISDAVTGYYEITGRPPLPPKYAFGYQQSYRTLLFGDENFMKSSSRYFRDSGFPCDLLVYLGSGYAEDGWNEINGSFRFNRRVFENPGEDLAELHNQHFRVMLHVTGAPDVHGTIADSGVEFSDEKHAKSYWNQHERFLDETPIDAWWPDDGDEQGIETRLARQRMYREGSLSRNPDIRPFALYRNGYAGMTRWGGVVWAGDNLSEWKTLERLIGIGLNVGVSYSPYWCTDTGGFFSTGEFDGELFMRWFQYSTFTPFLRSHGRPSALHTPHGWSRFRPADVPSEHYDDPYWTSKQKVREDISPDPRVELVCRKFAELRYRMLPYIYTLAREAHDTGIPMMRPMWLVFGAGKWYSGVEDQYMFGDSLLVAPVYTRAAIARAVALPDGVWYGLFDERRHEGGRQVVIDAPHDSIPVLVRAGGILPEGDVMMYVGEDGHTDGYGFDNLHLRIYSGADGEFVLYEDDGTSLAYERGIFTRTTIVWDETKGEATATGKSSIHEGKTREIPAVVIPEMRTINLTCTYQGGGQ